jgi:hypothetical protein
MLTFVLVTVLTGGALFAQDDAEEDERQKKFYVEFDGWIAQPVGAEYEPATRLNPINPFASEIIRFQQGTETAGYVRGGYDVGNDVGEFLFTWYSQDQDQFKQEFTPGTFNFGEILTHPLFAGYENDGRSDGFESNIATSMSDFRFDFAREAFRSDRLSAKWFVGYRRVKFKRSIDAAYFALSPVQAPLIPPASEPRPDLDPLPDQAQVSSKYSGRGLEAGFDVKMPLVKNGRLTFDAGFAIAALRGKIDSDYSAVNYVYTFTDPVSGEESIFPPPYNFGDTILVGGEPVAIATFVRQEFFVVGLESESRSTTSSVIDLYAGFRGRIWSELEWLAGFRSASYGDVAVELRPKVTSTSDGGVNLQDVTEVDRPVGYEGFYFGLAYRF